MYNDKKFWILFEWLQNLKEGERVNVATVSRDPSSFVFHLKHYIDSVRDLPEYIQIEFNTNYSMFKRVK